jgi:membrane-bound lytic murein transglycosylase D
MPSLVPCASGKTIFKDRMLMSRYRRLSLVLLSCTALFASGCANLATTAAVYKPKPVYSGTPVIPKGPLSQLDTAQTTQKVPVAATQPPKDMWERIRLGFAMPDITGKDVDSRIDWYASRPDYIERMSQRSSRYIFYIVDELERRRMPSELALLPFIESAFNPQAVSSAKAAGMWQFMPATGRSFDLRQNSFRDDRRDVVASTNAALDYLESLHQQFGDWHLALAAYNWGQGNVRRAIARNKAAGKGTGYLDLRMPAETRMYVPKLQAVKNIVGNPSAHSVTLPSIPNHPFFDVVTLDKDIDVALAAEFAGVSEADFRTLNPSLKHPVILANGTPTVLLPWDNAADFKLKLKAHPGPLATWTAYVVKNNVKPRDLAKFVGMSESELRRVNNIPPRMLVRKGSTVLVKRSTNKTANVTEYVADNAQLALAPEFSKLKIRVKRGDTLSGLAAKYGVSVKALTQWNNLKGKHHIRVGQRLIVQLR